MKNKEIKVTKGLTLIQNLELPEPLKLITVSEFQKRQYKLGSIENMVRQIKEVLVHPDGFEAILFNGSSLYVRVDGSYSKNGAGFVLNEQIEFKYSRSLNDLVLKTQRPRSNNFGGYNCSLYTEKFFGICEQWLSGYLPSSFKGLQVNVKDCSGNIITAEKLGIQYNMSLSNLEWCLEEDNRWAGRKALYFKKLTGKAWRFSCNDELLYQKSQTGTVDEIIDYLENNCVAVG